MKLGIVIPLKSKTISRNWETTVSALVSTLNSVINQTYDNYSVVVVGHEIPQEIITAFPGVRFESVSFPAPDRSKPDFSHRDMLVDKGLKIVKGFQVLQNQGVDYWFQLDSDDLLRNDFVESIQTVEGKAGAIIMGGYFVYNDIGRIVSTDNMVVYSGSTLILADRHVDIPKHETLAEKDMNCSPWGRYPHMTIADFFEDEIGQPYQKIYQPLLGYVLASGDNISDAWRNTFCKRFKAFIKPYILGKPISEKFKIRFGMK